MQKIKLSVDRFLLFLLSKRYFSLIWLMVFFIIFGLAFFLIYLDSIAIQEQINNDFNQQQKILARQGSEQTGLFLNNLEVQLKHLEWFCKNHKGEVLRETMNSIFIQNREMGIIDIGYFNNFNKQIEYLSLPGIPEINWNKVKEITNNNFESNNFKLSKIEVMSLSNERVFVISNIVIPIMVDSKRIGVLIARLDLSQLMKKIIGGIKSGKTGYAWVIDNNGLALYHPEKEFIGRNLFEARQKKKPYVSFNQVNWLMKERMMKGEEGTAEYESWWHKEVKGKITKLIAYTPVKNHAIPDKGIWSIAVVAPISEIAEPIDKAYFRHLAAETFILVGMFLFALLMLAYQNRISASLKARVSEQQEYIASILENSMDAIIFTNSNNLVQVWNKGAERMFEYNSGEMVGKSFHALVPEELDADDELRKINEMVNRDGYITNYVTHRITKSGRRIRTNISKTLIKSPNDNIIGYSIIVRDETEKIEIEHRIYNTEKLASIGILAAGVAHEINNPLAIILGYTDLLIEKYPKDSPEYNDLKLIESYANNAKKIVENLLGFARITEGLDDDIDIKSSIDTVVAIIKNTLFTKKIDIETQITNGIPHVRGDVREFEQVIFNLLNNSVAALKNIGHGQIFIKAYQNNDMVSIEINDNGEGIPNKVKPSIYDPFFTTKKIGEGTGLGLSLCYGIISKYGGKISFKSSSKEDNPNSITGTTFLIEMPIINN